MTEVTFETNAGLIYGITYGNESNPLILALHGYGIKSGYKVWEYYMNKLSNNYYIIGIDFPGFGDKYSNNIRKHKSRTMYMRIPGGPCQIVFDIINLVGKNNAYILGYDWGCGIGISCAILNRNKINGLILFHITYTELYQNELKENKININNIPIGLLWVDTEQLHPWKSKGNNTDNSGQYFKNVFKIKDNDNDNFMLMKLKPYDNKWTKNCYQAKFGDTVVEFIKQWLNKRGLYVFLCGLIY